KTLPQLLLHQRRKPVHPFAEVHGFRRHQHPDRSGRDQHSATHAFERRTARNTASTSRGLAPPGTLTLIVPIVLISPIPPAQRLASHRPAGRSSHPWPP